MPNPRTSHVPFYSFIHSFFLSFIQAVSTQRVGWLAISEGQNLAQDKVISLWTCSIPDFPQYFDSNQPIPYKADSSQAHTASVTGTHGLAHSHTVSSGVFLHSDTCMSRSDDSWSIIVRKEGDPHLCSPLRLDSEPTGPPVSSAEVAAAGHHVWRGSGGQTQILMFMRQTLD